MNRVKYHRFRSTGFASCKTKDEIANLRGFDNFLFQPTPFLEE
jgi:hypothetical protein